jgi:hypothetical protein
MTSAEYLICNARKELYIIVMVELEGTLCIKTQEGWQSGSGCGVKWLGKEITATRGKLKTIKSVDDKEHNYISDAMEKSSSEADNLSSRS